jgi:hypothetical protein
LAVVLGEVAVHPEAWVRLVQQTRQRRPTCRPPEVVMAEAFLAVSHAVVAFPEVAQAAKRRHTLWSPTAAAV